MNGLGQDQTPLLKLYLITTGKIKFCKHFFVWTSTNFYEFTNQETIGLKIHILLPLFKYTWMGGKKIFLVRDTSKPHRLIYARICSET